jgi:hypothetical protein
VTSTTVEQRQAALAVAGALTVVTLCVAAGVRVGWAADMRSLLAFGFAGLPPSPGTAISIFASNARLLAAVFAAVLIAQSPWLAGADSAAADGRHPVQVVLRGAVDAVLALAVAVNVALVGSALGAYGTRMAVAVLPHGPVELAAYSLALALYLRARRAELAVRDVAITAATCLALLAVGSALETFIAL